MAACTTNGAALAAQVVGLRKAEQDASLFARVQRIFDDMHLVYARGLALQSPGVLCIAIMLSMMRFARRAAADSLAAIVDLMATPGSSARDTIVMDPASHQRGTARFQAASENLSRMPCSRWPPSSLATGVARQLQPASNEQPQVHARSEQISVEALMDAVSRAGIDPTLD